MENNTDLSPQQVRLLSMEIEGIPKTYSKSAVIQSLVIDFNISQSSVKNVAKSNKSYVSKCVNGKNVTLLEARPERKRLKSYLSKRVARACLTIRIFKVDDDDDLAEVISPVFIITTNDQVPDVESMQLLSENYVKIQRRKDVRYKVQYGKYEEIDLLLSPYHKMSVKNILIKAR